MNMTVIVYAGTYVKMSMCYEKYPMSPILNSANLLFVEKFIAVNYLPCNVNTLPQSTPYDLRAFEEQ